MSLNAETNDESTRQRILQLAFSGDEARMQRFIDALTPFAPEGTRVILRGSAVTGTRWEDGQPFDADGPGTSDLDITFVGAYPMEHFEEMYIPGLHTVPFGEEYPDAAPPLKDLRQRLCEIAGRPVNLQASRNLVQLARNVLFDQPYYTLIGKSEDDEDEVADEDDDETSSKDKEARA